MAATIHLQGGATGSGAICGTPRATNFGPWIEVTCLNCLEAVTEPEPARVPQYPPGPYCGACGLTSRHWAGCPAA